MDKIPNVLSKAFWIGAFQWLIAIIILGTILGSTWYALNRWLPSATYIDGV